MAVTVRDASQSCKGKKHEKVSQEYVSLIYLLDYLGWRSM